MSKELYDKDKIEAKEAFKAMSSKEKFGYIFYYYWYLFLIIILVIGILISVIKSITAPNKDPSLFILCLGTNLYGNQVEEITDGLYDKLDMERETSYINLEARFQAEEMYAEATISTYMAVGMVDLVVADEKTFNKFACIGSFREIKDEKLAEGVKEEDLFYATILDSQDMETLEDYPFFPHDKTGDSKGYGIYIKDGPLKGYVVGIMGNAPHEELLEKMNVSVFEN